MAIRTLGKNFKYETMSGKVNQVYTIVAPDQNLHGILVKSMNNYNFDYNYVYGPVKPLNRSDTSCIRFPIECAKFNDYLIPAGQGFYFLIPDSYTALLNVSWDVLNADGSLA